MPFRRNPRLRLAAGCLAAAVWASGGCSSSGPPTIQVSPVQTQQTFSKPFDSAYALQRDDGERLAVLETVDDAGRRIVMTIRVVWKSPPTARLTEITSANAVIDVFAWSGPAASPDAAIHYVGQGIVKAKRSGDMFDVQLVNGSIRPAEQSGPVNDPIAVANVEGKFRATADAPSAERGLADADAVRKYLYARSTAGPTSPATP